MTGSLLLIVSCSSSPPKTVPEVAPATHPTAPQDTSDGLVPPDTVRSEEMKIVASVRIVTVGNSQGHYHLSCNSKLDSCLTPVPGKDYLVFLKTTRWKMPGASQCCATLKFFQDYSIRYDDQENVALVPDDGPFGIYILDSWSKDR